MPRLTIRPCFPFSATILLALGVLAGCGQESVTAPVPSPDGPGGPAGSALPPGIRFDWPSGVTLVPDESVQSIRYAVTTDRPLTARVQLDPDTTPGNGNEIELATRSFAAGGGNDQVDLTAGWYPYGNYIVRVVLSDGARTYPYTAFGLVTIAPIGERSADPFAGLRLLATSGQPTPVEVAAQSGDVPISGGVGPTMRRMPFVDTWHVLDPFDNLAPRFIAPLEFAEAVEIHRLQFFVFGRRDVAQKRIEIYGDTTDASPGTLLHQLDIPSASFAGGGWNSMMLDPPLRLAAGRYGVSFHARFEFTDHWGGNAPQGPGYVWVSAFGGAPFRKLTAEQLGFGANFSIRAMGRVDDRGKSAAAHRIKIPVGKVPVVTGFERPKITDDKTHYGYEDDDEENPVHVVWRETE